MKRLSVRLSAVMLAAACGLTTLPAMAQGMYAGADLGHARVSADGLKWNANGAALFAGYSFSDTLSAELGWRNLGSDKVMGVDLKASAVQLSALAGLPVSTDWQLYGRLGWNRLKAKASSGNVSASDNSSGLLWGLGAQYALSKQLGLRLEFQKPDSDTQVLSAGLVFKF